MTVKVRRGVSIYRDREVWREGEVLDLERWDARQLARRGLVDRVPLARLRQFSRR